ncbi:hypothetical protein CFIMG_002831RAa [Ceratocystis fimbriata CBS 114723]|uniref:Integral membrane protein n=1 Tax=Ceratocystis fimbriata CBS 114723 TaxID=1035309 RepID=A0A2C5X869_9PEZI|nr:hypothetical protein CFIMG_002831RAa [Ceratocystis fimbriata CBS 114723]
MSPSPSSSITSSASPALLLPLPFSSSSLTFPHHSTTPTATKSLVSRTIALSAVPPRLRPLLRAFLLGYVSTVGPQIFNLIFKTVMRVRRCRKENKNGKQEPTTDLQSLIDSIKQAAMGGLCFRDFPVFCAIVVGGSSLLEAPLSAALKKLAGGLSELAISRVSKWLATFISAYAGLQLLQSKKPPPGKNTTPPPSQPTQTLDMTLFVATRAIDVIVGELWARYKARREAFGKWTKTEAFISRLADPAVFAVSSAAIMWAWVYAPDRLPSAYNRWITTAAAIDTRLIEALRRCHFGWLIYGEETGQAPLLQEMCTEYKWPTEWGDPVLTVPFPCTMVHMGRGGSSCELHAIYLFAKTWSWMMVSYAPLILVLRLIRPQISHHTTAQAAKKAMLSAGRSSAVVAAFTALYYYGVCLTRTRIGPRVLGRDNQTCTRIDGGLCMATGCGLCGWSILLESPSKRKDLALFVAPRALGTVLPRSFPGGSQWKETAVFAASTAVILTCVAENKGRVRGMLGRMLAKILEA